MSGASPTFTEDKSVQESSSVVQADEDWDIKWRRNKVMQLLSQGKSQREIAGELDVHESTISRDLDHIQQEIDEAHKHWVQQVFRENQIALTGLTEVLKYLWRIARDNRQEMGDRMKAYLLIMECYNNRLTTVINKHMVKGMREQYQQWLKKEEEMDDNAR